MMKPVKLFLSILLLVTLNHGQTGQWDIFEAAVENSTAYSNPFRDVDLEAGFTGPSGQVVSVYGFYDGGTTWRFRHMPDETGTWIWTAAFSDGTVQDSGSFECIASDIPGMLSKDEANPRWFGFKGGAHGLLRAFHIGDPFFANQPNSEDGRPWSDQMRTDFLDWAQQQGYNMLSIASHYCNRDASGRGKGWNTPDIWDENNDVPNPAEFDRMESIMDELASREIMIYPFAGFFGSASDIAKEGDYDLYEFWVKYTTARIGSYWNILYLVTGPEWSQNTLAVGRPATEPIVDDLAAFIKQYDAYQHPLSVHDNGDKNASWMDYYTRQGFKSGDAGGTFSALLGDHTDAGDKPVFAQETFWPGNVYHAVDPSDHDVIRKKGWAMNMAASVIVFADMSGNSSSGFSGSLDLTDPDLHPEIHTIMNRVWDGFETFPFYEMDPRPDLSSKNMCLAKEGAYYLVYLENGGNVDIDVTAGTYNVTWVNGQDPLNDRRDGGTTTDGQGLSAPAEGDDWLVYLVKDGLPVYNNLGKNTARSINIRLTGRVQSSVNFSMLHDKANGNQALKISLVSVDGFQRPMEVSNGNQVFISNAIEPGVYIIRLRTVNHTSSRRLVLF